jgi:hypothetical protein
MIALAARIWDLPEPELPLPPTRTTARMSSPAAAAAAVVVMCDFIARPATSAQTMCEVSSASKLLSRANREKLWRVS